jgi:hypothetical protein
MAFRRYHVFEKALRPGAEETGYSAHILNRFTLVVEFILKSHFVPICYTKNPKISRGHTSVMSDDREKSAVRSCWDQALAGEFRALGKAATAGFGASRINTLSNVFMMLCVKEPLACKHRILRIADINLHKNFIS